MNTNLFCLKVIFIFVFSCICVSNFHNSAEQKALSKLRRDCKNIYFFCRMFSLHRMFINKMNNIYSGTWATFPSKCQKIENSKHILKAQVVTYDAIYVLSEM